MDEGEFSSFFRSQMQLGNRFAGPLFSILREAYGGTDSEVLRGNILQFLKRYSDYSSSAHVQGNLLRTLTRLGGLGEAVPVQQPQQVRLADAPQLPPQGGAGAQLSSATAIIPLPPTSRGTSSGP